MLIVCRCGHLKIKHINWSMDSKGIKMYCIKCCPTDFDEQIHPFIPDNLASLELEDEENG